MNTREKFYAVKDALDDNNQLLLIGEPRLENTAYEVSNLQEVKAALDAWQSFSWSETPGGLSEDITYLASLPSVSANDYNRMNDRLRQFSQSQLNQAQPLAVLEDAVADFDDEMFQMSVQIKESVRETLERASRAIEIPESLIVEGSISEPRFADGSLGIFWTMAEELARNIWTLAIYSWQEIKAVLADPATSHIWSIFDSNPDYDPDTVRRMKEDYIKKTFGENGKVSEICNAAGIPLRDVQDTTVRIAKAEMTEDVDYRFPLQWRRRRQYTMHGVNMEIRHEQAQIPESQAQVVLEMIQAMSENSSSPSDRGIFIPSSGEDEDIPEIR